VRHASTNNATPLTRQWKGFNDDAALLSWSKRMKGFLQIAVIALKAIVAFIELILACLP